jgi:hypothetical protein
MEGGSLVATRTSEERKRALVSQLEREAELFRIRQEKAAHDNTFSGFDSQLFLLRGRKNVFLDYSREEAKWRLIKMWLVVVMLMVLFTLGMVFLRYMKWI